MYPDKTDKIIWKKTYYAIFLILRNESPRMMWGHRDSIPLFLQNTVLSVLSSQREKQYLLRNSRKKLKLHHQ